MHPWRCSSEGEQKYVCKIELQTDWKTCTSILPSAHPKSFKPIKPTAAPEPACERGFFVVVVYNKKKEEQKADTVLVSAQSKRASSEKHTARLHPVSSASALILRIICFWLLSPVLTKLFAQSTLMIHLEGGQVCSQWRACRIFSFSSCRSSDAASLTHASRQQQQQQQQRRRRTFYFPAVVSQPLNYTD